MLVMLLQVLAVMAQSGHQVLQDLSGSTWKLKLASSSKWYTAKVPGNVHASLLRSGIIPDPFLFDHEKKVAWVADSAWDYSCSFNVSQDVLKGSHQTIQFTAIDGKAKIFLNKTLLGEVSNSFHGWVFPVKGILRDKSNELLVRFEPPQKEAIEKFKSGKPALPGEERIYVRKPQYQFGWDWGPRLVTSGIGNASLLSWSDARINRIQVLKTIINSDYADLNFEAEIESDRVQNMVLKGMLSNTRIKFDQQVKLTTGRNQVRFNVRVANPLLWYPSGQGAQSLYQLNLTLENEGSVVSADNLRFGIRTIELVQEPDTFGTSFYFKVNGKPVFMKGANYIPAGSFEMELPDSEYQHLVREAKDANLNMLRVWGGGSYPPDAFFEACDEQGILVWQDFMFACAMYPGDAAFQNNVRREIEYQVNRLKHHASLALWCGNNENTEGWNNWGWQKQYRYSASDSIKVANWDATLFRKIIPEVIHRLDPNRPYWPSSPSIGWGRKESLQQGDCHYWGVWWGMEPFEVYPGKTGRFMSEYGFQGMPSIFTFQQMMDIGRKPFDSASFYHHQKHPAGYPTIRTYLEREGITAGSLDEMIYASQWLQAKGMKIAMESHRVQQPKCMGTLFWQWNDCWPVTSWSAIDVYHRRKPMFYQAKQSFAPIMMMATSEGDNLLLKVIAEKELKQASTLKLFWIDFQGKTLQKEIVPINSIYVGAQTVYRIPKNVMLPRGADPAQTLLLAQLTSEDAPVALPLTYYFVKENELKLTLCEPKIKQIDGTHFEVSTKFLLKDLWLFDAKNELNLDQNFFDLIPGQPRTIELQNPQVSTQWKYWSRNQLKAK